MRICKECGEEKLLTEFPKAPRCKEGRQPRCRRCVNEAARERYAEKGKSIPLYREMYFNALSRARKKELSIDITPEWIEGKLEDGVCEITSLPLGERCSSFAPSLERVDPNRGYTQKNTKVVVWIYNRAKGTGTHEDVLQLAHALTGESYG